MTLNPSGDRAAGGAIQSAGWNQGNGMDLEGKNMTVKNNLLIACRTSGGGPGNGLPCTSIPNFAAANVLHDEYACDDMIFNDTANQGGREDFENNYTIGGGTHESGTCFLLRAGNANFITFNNNTAIDCANTNTAGMLFVNTGSGSFTGFKGFNNGSGAHHQQVTFSAGGWQNTGIYGTWTGNNSRANNLDDSQSNGTYCGNGISCSSVITETNDVWGASAWPTLNVSSTVAQIEAVLGTPPLIPPIPKNCTVQSPFTTQTSLPSC